MCGRYSLDADIDELIDRYKAILKERAVYNMEEVFPTDIQPIVVNRDKQEIVFAKWGFYTDFTNRPIINARAETINEKTLFRKHFLLGRCLVPATSFFEWEKNDGKKIKRRISIEKEKIFSLAGLMDESGSFTIITTSANQQMKGIHDRMPVIIQKDKEEIWLNHNIKNPNQLNSMLIPYNLPLVID
ncbi:MAG: SOS response-associated peptidase [Gudongella sp.]|nr:SOS response-associated peptidase [Gudongella sp.]